MKKFALSFLLVLFLTSLAFAKVNINKANVTELQELSGIGPAKAEAIVKFRSKHGKFKKIEDLGEIQGIGPKLLKKIKSDCEL